jgi:hypothetical protein
MSRCTSRCSPCIAFVVSLLVIIGHHETLSEWRASASQASDEGALRLLATQFFTHYAKEELGPFMSLWSINAPERAVRRQAAAKFFAAFEKIEVTGLMIRRVMVEGDAAKAWVDSELRAVETASGSSPTCRVRGGECCAS